MPRETKEERAVREAKQAAEAEARREAYLATVYSGYKFTWSEVSMASVLTFVPILNLIWVFVILRG